MAAIEPPYVLATHSMGAFIAGAWAARWPAEVAGMVLMDPTSLTPFPAPINRPDLMVDEQPGGIRFSRRSCWAEQRPTLHEAGIDRTVVLSSAVGRWLRNEPMEWHQPLSLAEVDDLWVVKQKEWVQHTAALHVVADTAGHLVARDAPELAATVIEAVVDAARGDASPHLDRARLATAGGQLGPS